MTLVTWAVALLIAGFSSAPSAWADDVDATEPELAPLSTTPEGGIPDDQLRIPPHERVTPTWGLTLGASPKPFTGGNAFPTQGNGRVRAGQLDFEWLPHFIQSYGVLGIGAQATYYLYTTAPTGTQANTGFPGWSAGAHVRYQLRFFHEQILVPMVGYRYDYLRFRQASGGFEAIRADGPFAGLGLLLNQLDPETTRSFFVNVGVVRTYLVAEAHQLRGAAGGFKLEGRTYLFGLRFEF